MKVFCWPSGVRAFIAIVGSSFSFMGGLMTGGLLSERVVSEARSAGSAVRMAAGCNVIGSYEGVIKYLCCTDGGRVCTPMPEAVATIASQAYDAVINEKLPVVIGASVAAAVGASAIVCLGTIFLPRRYRFWGAGFPNRVGPALHAPVQVWIDNWQPGQPTN